VGLYTGFAIVLGVWGVITLVRRIAESEAQQVERRGGRADTRTSGRADERTSGRADQRTSGRADQRTSGRADGRTSGPADQRTSGQLDGDEIDYEELRRAEEEVRDLGTDVRPEDGFEGDDWGPGAPRKPPYH
jgi:hypothetical protein